MERQSQQKPVRASEGLAVRVIRQGPRGDLAGSAVLGAPGAPIATEIPPGGTLPGPGAMVATVGPGIRYIDTGGVLTIH